MTTIRFEGGQELAKNLDLLSARGSRKVQRDVLIEAGEPIKTTMRQLAPRDPGAPDLADSMTISNARPRAWGSNVVAVAIGPAKGFFYGFFQEYGTVHHKAQPFMRPAYDQQIGGGSTLGRIRSALASLLISKGFGSTRASGGGTGL